MLSSILDTLRNGPIWKLMFLYLLIVSFSLATVVNVSRRENFLLAAVFVCWGYN